MQFTSSRNPYFRTYDFNPINRLSVRIFNFSFQYLTFSPIILTLTNYATFWEINIIEPIIFRITINHDYVFTTHSVFQLTSICETISAKLFKFLLVKNRPYSPCILWKSWLTILSIETRLYIHKESMHFFSLKEKTNDPRIYCLCLVVQAW